LKKNLLLISSAVAALAFTEYLFAAGQNAFGIIAAIAFTLVLYGLASTGKMEEGVTEVVEGICLLLLYVLLISMLPWFYIKQEYLFPAVYLILIALCIWYIKDADLSLKEVGGRLPHKKIHLLSLPVGVLTGAIEYLILKPPPPLPYPTLGYMLRTVATMTLFVGLGEELLFRGILLTRLEKTLSPRLALIMSSLIFTILHFTWRIPLELVFVFIVGLILGYIFQRTKSLFPPIVIHAINNIVLVAVLPFF
jgi:membrane protease YdiL (CAAX protease family)